MKIGKRTFAGALVLIGALSTLALIVHVRQPKVAQTTPAPAKPPKLIVRAFPPGQFLTAMAVGGPQPSVGLYWVVSGDPTTGAGICAPQWQLLFRTDNNTLYYKSGTACTAWTPFEGAGGGSVTNITCGTGLQCTPNPITSSGTAAIDTTGVTPGGYTYSSFTVNAEGQLTAASSGIAPTTGMGAIPQVAIFNSSSTLTSYLSITGGSAGLTIESTNGSATSQPALFTTTRASGTDGENVCVGGGCELVSGTGHEGCTETAFGIGALVNVTTGADNVAFGTFAGSALTSGQQDTAIGYEALENNQTSFYDTAVGYGAMLLYTNGVSSQGDNTAMGVLAMGAVTQGSSNTCIGVQACEGGVSANLNGLVAVGESALQGCTTCSNDVAIGYNADPLITNTNQNVSVGVNALSSHTGGSDETSIGGNSLRNLTTGDSDTALGQSSGSDMTSGSTNICIGKFSCSGITTGSNNAVFGAQSVNLPNNLTSELVIGDGSGVNHITSDSHGHTAFWGTAQNANNLSSCGTGTPTIATGSTDITGQITEAATATGCTMTWTGTPSAAPFCLCTANAGGVAALCDASGSTTSALVIVNASASGDVITYHCFIPSGNL